MDLLLNEVVLSGRLARGPVRLADGTLHFQMQAGAEHPVHCFGTGVNLENLGKFCKSGDEISVEGELCYYQFANEAGTRLLVKVRHASYGRKGRTALTSDHLG